MVQQEEQQELLNIKKFIVHALEEQIQLFSMMENVFHHHVAILHKI
jgi:hypothetical protein